MNPAEAQDMPVEGKFKIAVVGPLKNGVSKTSGKPYKVYKLQFEDDSRWYDTFWTRDNDPQVGDELEGTKDYSAQYDNYSFKLKGAGRNSFNPAAAQAQVMVASATIVNGYLALGDNYQKFAAGDDSWKNNLSRYMNTVFAVSKQVKDNVVNMGSMNMEKKEEVKSTQPQAPQQQPQQQEVPFEDSYPTENEVIV